MSVRQHPKDPAKQIIDYYPQGRKGKRTRITLVCSKAEAYAYESDLRRQHTLETPINPKIIDAIPAWLEYYKNNRAENTYIDVVKCLTNLRPHFGMLQFSKLTPSMIEQYKKKRLDAGVAKITINKELSYFGSLVNWATENNYALPLPFKIKRFGNIRSPKPVVPLPEEIEALIDNIEQQYRLILLLIYDMAMRRSEALHVKAEDVMLKYNTVRVIGKGNKEAYIPITTKRLKKELTKAIQITSKGYLSINPRTKKPWYSIRKALIRAAEKAGIEQRVYHHLLRHSFGTHALSAGINVRALQGIMRHSTIKVTERYMHPAFSYLQTEGAKFEDYIGKPKKPKVAKKKKKTKRKK